MLTVAMLEYSNVSKTSYTLNGPHTLLLLLLFFLPLITYIQFLVVDCSSMITSAAASFMSYKLAVCLSLLYLTIFVNLSIHIYRDTRL